MLKGLKELMNSLKEVQTEDLSKRIYQGVCMGLNGVYRTTFPLYRKIMIFGMKIEAYMDKKAFKKIEDQYAGTMVKVDVEKYPNFKAMTMGLRTKYSIHKKNFPAELHLISNWDIAGIETPKYILVSVKEGEVGVREEGLYWIYDGFGKVYTYKKMYYIEYIKWVADKKNHPFKMADSVGHIDFL